MNLGYFNDRVSNKADRMLVVDTMQPGFHIFHFLDLS